MPGFDGWIIGAVVGWAGGVGERAHWCEEENESGESHFWKCGSPSELCVPVRSGSNRRREIDTLDGGARGGRTYDAGRVEDSEVWCSEFYAGYFYIPILEYIDRNMWYETDSERDSVTALALSPEASQVWIPALVCVTGILKRHGEVTRRQNKNQGVWLGSKLKSMCRWALNVTLDVCRLHVYRAGVPWCLHFHHL